MVFLFESPWEHGMDLESILIINMFLLPTCIVVGVWGYWNGLLFPIIRDSLMFFLLFNAIYLLGIDPFGLKSIIMSLFFGILRLLHHISLQKESESDIKNPERKDKIWRETSGSNKKEYYKMNNLFKIFDGGGGCVASKEIQEGTLLLREKNELIPWSKFKHSCCQGQCCANSEFVTHEKGQVNEFSIFEIRAVSTIVSGGELTLNRAGSVIFMKNLKFRREYLKEKFGFDCDCDLCEIEEREGDKNRYELYENMIIQAEKLHQNRIKSPNLYEKGLQTWRQEIACYKEMYRFAQECQADRRLIFERIINPGITATIEAYEYAEQNPGNLKLMIEFKNDCFAFIKSGEKLIEICAGKESNYWFWKSFNAGKKMAEEKFATIDNYIDR